MKPDKATYARCVEAAFFDLDKTVIARAAMAALHKPFRREGLISRRVVAKIIWTNLIFMQIGAKEEKLKRIRDDMLKLTKGWDQQRVGELVRETIDQYITPIIYEEALDLIHEHHEAGRLVVIVSASPREIVEPLGTFLGADFVIASRSEIDDFGKYTGRMREFVQGPVKVDAMQKFSKARDIDLKASYAYSDSATDIPMLDTVGNPVAVNPDRALRRYAEQQDWPIVKFDKPVRITGGTGVEKLKQPGPVAGIVATAAASVAVALLIYRRRHK